MMLRSGVRPVVNRSKVARETPRRPASRHNRSMQLLKSAAAARIASAVISALPEAPDCPLHPVPPLVASDGAAGTEPCDGG